MRVMAAGTQSSAHPSPPPPPQSQPKTTTPIATATPTVLNRYQLGRLLGRGSFAKVHQACSIVDNSVVAIKIISKNANLDSNMESRIVREVAAMRRLQHHPNVLKIHEVMATKTKIYLVMEYASGGELFNKVLRRGRFTEVAARRYFQQLVSALHSCHQIGVAHRDLKPQNLLLDQNGNLKVSDFGLSALPEQLKNGLLHTACGTPAYTAPEVMARRGYDGAKADAWSCGVILYVLLAGFLPFDDRNLLTMYKKIQRKGYQFPSWISRQARSVIYQLLDPNPETRMSIEALMNLSWFKKSLQLKGEQENSLFDNRDCKIGMVSMNAFDIISLSSGLDLSGLFEVTKRKEKRFTTVEKAERVVEKVKEVGEKLGYRVERGKSGGVIGLGKLGRMVLVAQVLEIAPQFLLVEMKVVDACGGGGGAVEFEEVHWTDLQVGLQDIVLSWHNNDVIVM
ncbi:CBL-interacting serine/threonine-protein kinase 7-like [Mangifera indica]|uniref:CBL-interacting serine/threonine-protein kinase 7-like n=1 Tax=Mangifera indica TaxID=29780 RepID=UPI001CF93714|nr:CBL-interacting serine/threonine-protein kinase 7-like [Mangifera indica]